MRFVYRGAAVFGALAIVSLLRFPAGAEEKSGGRVSQGLLVLYAFEEPGGDAIEDRSGVGERLDLKIETPQAVHRSAGPFRTTSPSRIVSVRPAKKITEAVKQSGELTLEIWVRPNDDRQAGPARIASLSSDATHRNFTLGQNADRYDVRLRTTKTDANGLPSISTPAGAVKAELTHVVYTRDRSGAAKIYLNGAPRAAAEVAGELSSWSDDFR
ncbi:MAG TPA: LamG-like jellyroll fold domain-containing protein, partial [Thermomicrobiales bacterium]|nr:LamG-like jellyroll fold domain-containing protein [Thermomicrobiales bacterium]